MIYLVSGWLRHGTSMMMQALGAGGVPLVYSAKRDAEASGRWHDAAYTGNDGYFELTAEELSAPDFPLPYEGKALKCLRYQVLNIPAHEYRIIYMRRDGEETRQSMQALMGGHIPADVADRIDRETAKIVGILRQRRDCQVVEVHYQQALASPLRTFESLAWMGWPIDPTAAAAVVDPGKCRFRREALAEGV